MALPDKTWWKWIAIYDGSEQYPQYNEDGSENLYSSIDRKRLTSFAVLHEDKIVIHVHMEGKRKLIARRIPLMQGLFNAKKVDELFIVGWQELIEEINVQTIAVCFRDGHVELLPRFKKELPWAQPFANFLPGERLPGQGYTFGLTFRQFMRRIEQENNGGS